MESQLDIVSSKETESLEELGDFSVLLGARQVATFASLFPRTELLLLDTAASVLTTGVNEEIALDPVSRLLVVGLFFIFEAELAALGFWTIK